MSLPDLKKWEQTEDQQRVAEKREIIAETLQELREVLKYPMTLAQIRELMPEASSAMKDWITVWFQQGHVQRKKVGGQYIYTLTQPGGM